MDFESELMDLIAKWREKGTSWDEIATALASQIDATNEALNEEEGN